MEETRELPPEPPPEAPSAPAMSLGGRLVNVFATPGEVFEEVKATRASTANWLAPALILIVVSWVAAALIFSQDAIRHQLSEITERAIKKQVEKTHMSEQQAIETGRYKDSTTSIPPFPLGEGSGERSRPWPG